MPSYSTKSSYRLSTASLALQKLFNAVIPHYDNSILYGFRPQNEQEELFAQGRTKVHFPDSKHNKSPSEAVDSAPYIPARGGIPWPQTPNFFKELSPTHKNQLNQYIKDMCQFYHYAGYVQCEARHQNLSIRWGGDWDRDHCFSDQTFDDLVHFEEHEK